MKKSIITAVALFCAMFAMSAQDVSDLNRAARLAYEWLESEGYKPYVDGYGVCFELDDCYMYVNNSEDEDYLQIMYYGLDLFDLEEEPGLALAAVIVCNEVTRDIKLVKAHMSEDGVISLAVETYLDETPDIGQYMETAISYILSAAIIWQERYAEYETE